MAIDMPGRGRVAALVVALGALVVASGEPFILVPVGIWGLVVCCRAYAKSERWTATAVRPFRYHLCASGVPYLISMGIATTAFVLLTLCLRWFGDDLGFETLQQMENLFATVSGFFADNLKLSEVKVLGILLAILLVSAVLSARDGRRDPLVAGPDSAAPSDTRAVLVLHRAVEVYARHSGPVAAGLATMASLTFFGLQLGAPTDDLQVRIKTVRAGYAEVAIRTEAALTQRVTQSLYTKVRQAFPAPYGAALDLPPQLDRATDDLREHAARARSGHGVTVSEVEELLRSHAERRPTLDALDSRLRVEGGGRPPTVPPTLSRRTLDAAQQRVVAHDSGPPIELVDLGHRRFTLQIEKVVTERIAVLTKPLTEAVPILEPLMQGFVESLDQAFQERIGRAYDRLLEVAVRDAKAFDGAVEREARAIVAETDVGPPVERSAARAEQQSGLLRQALDSVALGRSTIDLRVDESVQRQRSRPVPRELQLLPYLLPPRVFPRPPPFTYPYRNPDAGRPPAFEPRAPAPRPPPRPPPRPGGRFW